LDGIMWDGARGRRYVRAHVHVPVPRRLHARGRAAEAAVTPDGKRLFVGTARGLVHQLAIDGAR